MTTPLLTVAVPTYRRVELLERCLRSLVPKDPTTWQHVELVVSDNSPDYEVADAVDHLTGGWGIPVRYYRNPPGTGAVRNFNLCIDRADGVYNLMLHDDDYLLPGAIDRLVEVLRTADVSRDQVLLFGVEDVDLSEAVIRRRGHSADQWLPPASALRRLLSTSSFVRVPGLVVRSSAYREVGGFSIDAHTQCDLDMSVRLFSRFGVRCVPHMTSAYTVHPGSITTTVFTPETIDRAIDIMSAARQTNVLSDREIDRLQRHFFHQFVLAGTWRAIKRRDMRAAREAYALFGLPGIRAQGTSVRWLPVRIIFALLSGAPWHPSHLGSTGAPSGARTTREW